MNLWAILWHVAGYAAELTTFVAFVFGGACLFDGKPEPRMPRPRLVGILSLWVALLSFVAAVEFLEWARLAVK
jgi:hypothetical protein